MNQFDPLIASYQDIIQLITAAGGRFIFVGGCVRDTLMGISTKDIDAEVYNLTEKQILHILGARYRLSMVGKSFGVIKITERHLDVSLPRLDQKVGNRHQDFQVTTDPYLDFTAASKRRDLTINAMGFDPVTGQLLDSYHGQEDIQQKRLRATDPLTFGEDPLRALRVIQFAARFDMDPDDQLMDLLRLQDLGTLSPARFQEEFYKLLIKGIYISKGFNLLKESNLIRFFPALELLMAQPIIWNCALESLDQAALHIAHEPEEWPLMLAVLTYGLYQLEQDPTLPAKTIKGSLLPNLFLSQLKVSAKVKAQVLKIISLVPFALGLSKDSLSPAHLRQTGADIYQYNITFQQIAWVAHHWGNSHTLDFLNAVKDAGASNPQKITPMVQGKHLLELGLEPGPAFKKILDRCFKVQLEENIYQVASILKKAMGTE